MNAPIDSPPTRATKHALDTARITGDEPTREQLDALVAATSPTDEAGYRAAVSSAAREVIEAQTTGNRGDARQAVMGFADTIDVDHGAADARDDQAAAAKAEQQRERDAALDPAQLAAGIARDPNHLG